MKKVFRFFFWLFYVILTIQDRHCYSMGMIKGCHCLGYTDDLTGRTYKYLPTKKPERSYLTFKQFMNNESLLTK